MSPSLPFFRFSGNRLQIGRQHGEACSTLIAEHLKLALERLGAAGISADIAVAVASSYRPFVREHAPDFDDEIVGLAEGAGLTVDEAYLLQLRAEVYADVLGKPEAANECTTFAIEPEVTADGVMLAGQNADLPHIYARFMIVMHLQPDTGPEILMATPAGQISYIGISSAGAAVFANFLNCGGWRRGFPRYLFSRFALEKGSVEKGFAALRALPRASSRNVIMVDASGDVGDLENTPTRSSVVRPRDGILVHSNHYIADDLLSEERADEVHLHNSRVRLESIRSLIAAASGTINPESMAGILRNRDGAPNALSVERHDRLPGASPADDQYMTVASVIASPAQGRIWVTAGPPSRSQYVEYSFAHGRHDGFAF
jgi:isopenicillin-N N-acyltransferase-like protein